MNAQVWSWPDTNDVGNMVARCRDTHCGIVRSRKEFGCQLSVLLLSNKCMNDCAKFRRGKLHMVQLWNHSVLLLIIPYCINTEFRRRQWNICDLLRQVTLSHYGAWFGYCHTWQMITSPGHRLGWASLHNINGMISEAHAVTKHVSQYCYWGTEYTND